MEAIVAGKALLRWCLYGWFVDPIKDHFNGWVSNALPPISQADVPQNETPKVNDSPKTN